EVAGLNPKGAAVAAHGGAEPSLRRKPQPGLRREALAAFVERAVYHQKLAAGRKVEHNRSVWRPALHPHLLAAVVAQRNDFNAGPVLCAHIHQGLSVAAHWRAIL